MPRPATTSQGKLDHRADRPVNLLLIHQNFPGQFRHLAQELQQHPVYRVQAIARETAPGLHGIHLQRYRPARTSTAATHPYLLSFESAVLHGQQVARALLRQRSKGYRPDVTLAHPGWGETLFIQSTSGNDLLYGYASDDSLTGGLGNDTLYGYAGNDALDGGEGHDSLDGGNGNDTLLGGLGRDTLNGGQGHDLLMGGEGNDTLYGDDGNDTLIGGAGNDYLNGGSGSDTYSFEQGFGQDTISNYDNDAASIDQVVFGEGISADQLWFSRSGQNLNISVIGSTDQVTLSSWYSGDSYHLDQFVSADGKTLLEGQVQNLVNAMAAFGVPAGAESNLTPEQHQQLEVVVAANWK